MEYGLIVHKGDNIGDFIQAVAANQFNPNNGSAPVLIERESLSQYRGTDVFAFMNAWFMRSPEKGWPPSDSIHPKFLSFHINSIAKEGMLSNASIEYLKRYEPIGCRDRYTLKLLKERGVDAWFSGCMTLTLGEKYTSSEKTGKIYICNLPIPSNRISQCVKNTIILLKELFIHPCLLAKISSKIESYPPQRIRKWWDAANIINTYITCIDKEILEQAEYINHIIPFSNYQQMLEKAEELIKMYAKAKFVITDKIHCAMPCLAVGTPVVWIESEGDEEYKCRLDGISELFNRIHYTNGKASLKIPNFKYRRLSINNFPKNPLKYIALKEKILDEIQNTLQHI